MTLNYCLIIFMSDKSNNQAGEYPWGSSVQNALCLIDIVFEILYAISTFQEVNSYTRAKPQKVQNPNR